MRDNDHVEPVELDDDELKTVAAGVFGLEQYMASMRSLQEMSKYLNQTIQLMSQDNAAALSRV